MSGCTDVDAGGMADFIPAQDAQFMHFAVSFASGISSAPSAYMLGPGDVDTINQAVSGYVEALARSSDPGTRTAPSVNGKDTARNACRDLIRMYAQQFRANMGISNEQLIAIGVQRRPTRLGKRKCPQTSPVIGFKARTAGDDTLTYGDALTQPSGSGRKPYGAERLELFAAYDHPRPRKSGQLPPDDVIYLGSFRKSPMVIPHGLHKHEGEPTYWGRWAGHNDDVGPWSLPVTFVKQRNASSKSMQTATDQPSANDLRLAA